MERHDPSEVQPGDIVTIERGVPGKPGHETFTFEIVESLGKGMKGYEVTVGYVRRITEPGAMYRVTRITRPAPPIPDEPGTRFWAVDDISKVTREYLVTDEGAAVALDWGTQWDLADFPHTVVPAPEPETVPVPADLIREAEEWAGGSSKRSSVAVLGDIVEAVRGWEVEL